MSSLDLSGINAGQVVAGVDLLLKVGGLLVERLGEAVPDNDAELLARLRRVAIAETDATIAAGQAAGREGE